MLIRHLDHLSCSKMDSVLGTLVEKGKVKEVSQEGVRFIKRPAFKDRCPIYRELSDL